VVTSDLGCVPSVLLRGLCDAGTPVVSKIPSEDDPIGSKHVKGKTVIKNVPN
jgi:hypothetical protein